MKKCSKLVYNGQSWLSSCCTRNAKVERDGKPYCNLHDPVKRAERQAMRNETMEAEYKERFRINRLNSAAPALLTVAKTFVEFATSRAMDGKPGLTIAQLNTILDAAHAAIAKAEKE